MNTDIPTTSPEPLANTRSADDTVLRIRGLKTHFQLDHGTVHAVDGVDLDVPRGKTLGVVGESGCGKSQTAFSVLRLIPRPGRIMAGEILFNDRDGDTLDLTKLAEDGEAIRRIRGHRIAMVFQEPMTSLSPVHTVGSQISEAVRLHLRLKRSAATKHTIHMMSRVGIPDAARRFDQYPHEMSGGLRQRAMIAMALSCQPTLLIADEPTTALDVTIQAQILNLMRELQAEFGMSILLITHDLGVVAQMADEVAVMYMGRVVERAGVHDLFEAPQHPYTRGLLNSIPSLTGHRKQALNVIRGSVPDPFAELPGCPFAPRCDEAVAGKCDLGDRPLLVNTRPRHSNACLLRHEEAKS